MKIEIVCISNIKSNGAACHMLIIDEKVHIMLDCGIN